MMKNEARALQWREMVPDVRRHADGLHEQQATFKLDKLHDNRLNSNNDKQRQKRKKKKLTLS